MAITRWDAASGSSTGSQSRKLPTFRGSKPRELLRPDRSTKSALCRSSGLTGSRLFPAASRSLPRIKTGIIQAVCRGCDQRLPRAHGRITLMPSSHPPIPDFLYGTAWKEERTPALVELALRAGFRGIDTANQRRHYFEEGVGQGLAAAYRAGVVTRPDLFLQTKFTYRGGQDHRLPYDPAASRSVQVAQSIANSLDHLATGYVDSYVLHGPSSNHDWTDADTEVWEAMRKERDAGRTRLLGVSNVSLRHLQQMAVARAELPAI